MNKENLKKYIFIIILVAIILIIASIVILSNSSRNTDNNKLKEKLEQEIKYMDFTLISIANKLNNITYENYELLKEKNNGISKENKDSSNNNQSNQSSQSSQDDSKNNQSDNSSSSSSNSDSQQSSNNLNEKYEIQQSSILNNKNSTPDWQYIKNEIEIFYSSWPNIIVDLHQNGVNNDDILNFGYEIDNLILNIKNENKIETISSISKLYSYIPKYSEQTSNDNDTNKYIYYTKSNIISAYALIEQENWEDMKLKISKSQEYFNNIINDIDRKNKNKINETYVLLNEMNNSTSKKDKDIFYIKYKNLMETIDMI